MSTRIAIAVGLAFLLLLIVASVPAGAFPASSQLHENSAAVAAVIIPLYVSSTSSLWQKVIAEKKQFTNVSFVVVVNPDSGVGPSKDPNFAKEVTNMQSAGITVLGYDWTGYGKVSQKQVESNMTDYENWYGVDGIFFDGMSSSASTASYYKTDANYAQSLGFTMTVGNPGTNVNAKLYGIFTFLNIWETHSLPSAGNLKTGELASQQSYIANKIMSLPSASKLDPLDHYVRYLFITSSANYGALPSYFGAEISFLSQT